MGYFRGLEIIFVMGLVRVLHVAIEDHYSFVFGVYIMYTLFGMIE